MCFGRWNGARIAWQSKWPPHIKTRVFTKFPFLHGMLRANGETVEGPRRSDWFDVFVDERDNLVLVLLDVRSSAESPQSSWQA